MTAVTERPTLFRTGAAELILPEGVDRGVWLGERRKGVGGSDIAGILGLSRWSSPYQVWLEKTGRSPGVDDNPAMRWGRAVEPVMREWFTEDTGIPVTTTGMWRSVAHPLAFANPDGLTPDGGLEIKAHGWRMGEEWEDDQVSDAAELQSQWYMGVLGVDRWWVIAKVGDDAPVIRSLTFDRNLFEHLVLAAERFWRDHIVNDVAPALVARDLDAVRDVHRLIDRPSIVASPGDVEPLISEWESAKAAQKAAEARTDLALANLRNVVGGAEEVHVLGEPRLTCKANGTFAAGRFAEDHPDVAAACTTTRQVLDVERLKTNHPDLYGQYRARVLRAVTPKEK